MEEEELQLDSIDTFVQGGKTRQQGKGSKKELSQMGTIIMCMLMVMASGEEKMVIKEKKRKLFNTFLKQAKEDETNIQIKGLTLM